MNMYPIQDGPSVPYEVMAPHEAQCRKNHQQSIARISERGGFSACEAWAVVNGLGYNIAYETLDDGTTFHQAKEKWFAYAERINLHYDRLATLEKEHADLLAKLAQCETERNQSGATCAMMRSMLQVVYGWCVTDNPSDIDGDAVKRILDSSDCGQELLNSLREFVAELEQAIGHLSDGGNNSKHDPSWIRPVTMTRPEMVNACQQAYHRVHSVLSKLKAVLR